MPPKIPAFSDVQQVMDRAAMNSKGVRYRLPTWGQAVNFRQRCYRFRVAQRELIAKSVGYISDAIISTPYDDLELTIEDTVGDKIRKRPTQRSPYYDVVIMHRELHGELFEEGEPLEDLGSEYDDTSNSLDLE